MIKKNPDELVPRSISDILQNIDRFLVVEALSDGKIIGTVSWAALPEIGSARHPSVEIKTLSVDTGWRKRGIGCKLVQRAIRRVKSLRPEQIVVLTFTPAFFKTMGFVEVPKEKLMYKLYTGCLNCTKYDSPFTCPEVAMSLQLKYTDGSKA
ncbi:MAG: GNAT family N-acetyltransferase [Lentisphaerota bacterium]